MIFTPTSIPGAYIVDVEPLRDERGFFARSWCAREFAAHGLSPDVVQCNISYNARRGIIRGLHYQVAPHEEIKLVRCTLGAIYDVVVDLRPSSPAFRRWLAVELTAENRRMLYIPDGCAHGFQTVTDASEVFYQMSTLYHPESARTARWDDPAFGVEWPIADPILSEKDRNAPLWA